MTYDFEMLAQRVEKKKKRYLTELFSAGALILVSLVIIIVNFDKTLTFVGGATIFASLLWIYFSTTHSNPSILFSPELEGVNIRENEYVQRGRVGLNGSTRRVHLPHTYSNRKSVSKHMLRGTVYLRLSNGDVTSWSGLFPKHMEIYEEGDTLYKPRGARFMIVVGRNVREQPCPFCGAINQPSDRECRTCALLIVHQKNERR